MSTSRRMWPLDLIKKLAGYEPAHTIKFSSEGNETYQTLHGSYNESGVFSFEETHRCTGKLAIPGLKSVRLAKAYSSIFYKDDGGLHTETIKGAGPWTWIPPKDLSWFVVQFYDVNGELGSNNSVEIEVGPAIPVNEIRSNGDYNLAEFILRSRNCTNWYCFGDSIGYGQGGNVGFSYLRVLFDYHRQVFKNLTDSNFHMNAVGNAVLWHGKTATSSKRIIDEMKSALTASKYSNIVVHIHAGINDWAFQTGEEDIKSAVKEIMDFLNTKLDYSCRVLWVTPIDTYTNVEGRNYTIGMYRKWITEAVMANVSNPIQYIHCVVQGQSDLLGVPFSQEKYNGINLIIHEDGVHPTDLGYQLIGDAIWNKISELIETPTASTMKAVKALGR